MNCVLASFAVFMLASGGWAAWEGLAKWGAGEQDRALKLFPLVLSAVTGIGVIVGFYFANSNLILTREGQYTDRFSKAVGHLGGADQHAQLGGVYALERLARDSASDQQQILKVLVAKLRSLSPAKAKDRDMDSSIPYDEMGPLAVEILSVLAKPEVKSSPHDPLNLSGLNLSSARLELAAFPNAHFMGSILRHASLRKADLSGASFGGSDLQHAELIEADLRGAWLQDAKLVGANIKGADLRNAKGLTKPQLASAKGDCKTKLPDESLRPVMWGHDADEQSV